MKTLIRGLGSLCLVMGASVFSKTAIASCTYRAEPAALKVAWTSYKTTARKPVNGQFKDVRLSGQTGPSPLDRLVVASHVEVGLFSSDTMNAERNQNLLETFFENISSMTVVGTARDFVYESEPDGSGRFTLDLTMNGMSGSVPMDIKWDASGVLRAHGTLKMSDFALGPALAALDERCHDYHAGADGVSKVWDDVDVRIEIPAQRTCAN